MNGLGWQASCRNLGLLVTALGKIPAGLRHVSEFIRASSPCIFRHFIFFALLLISTLSFSKGIVTSILPGNEPYFLINYKNGLIRRGLIGELISFFYDQHDIDRVLRAALWLHLASCVLLMSIILIWIGTLLDKRSRRTLVPIFLLFATSQFLPMQAFKVGPLDVYDYILIIVVAIATIGEAFIVAGALGSIGPFIHDGYIFPWGALLILALWQRIEWKRLLVVAFPILTTVIVWVYPDKATGIIQTAKLQLPQLTKDGFIAFNLGQTISSSLQIQLFEYRYNFLNFLMASFFYLFPVVIMTGIYASLRMRRDVVFLIAATVVPATILIVANDLSRFLISTAFTGFLAILYMQTVRPVQIQIGGPLIFTCYALAAFAIMVPFVWAQFDGASVLTESYLFPIFRTPIASATTSFVSFYNRNNGPRIISELGIESAPGTIWDEEESGWHNTWIRRSGTNVFDVIGTKGTLVGSFLATITRTGDRIVVKRTNSWDGNDMMYSGMITDSQIDGIYPGGKWHAVIIK